MYQTWIGGTKFFGLFFERLAKRMRYKDFGVIPNNVNL